MDDKNCLQWFPEGQQDHGKNSVDLHKWTPYASRGKREWSFLDLCYFLEADISLLNVIFSAAHSSDSSGNSSRYGRKVTEEATIY